MSIVPQELITEILSRLSVKSLLRFLCVSKSWFAQINDPGFMKMHLENNREGALILQTWNWADHPPLNYYLVNFSDENQPVKIFPPFYNPDRFSQIVDSCNGLVCIRTCDGETVIWNPSIRKYKKLPFESTNFAVGKRNSAFGYDAVNNDYKVLKIVENFAGAFEVKVYSLKAHSWRRVEDEWPYKDSRISLGPVFSNGALHWLVKSEMGETRLLAFQLTTEKFQEHTLPVEPQSIRTLEVLGGSLCVSAYGPEARAIDFWMMKETSWSRLCTVSVTTRYDERLKGCRVVFSTDGQKEVLTEMDYGKDNGSKDLFWYNIKKKRRRITLTHIGDKFWTGTCEDDELPILDVGNLSQFISAS